MISLTRVELARFLARKGVALVLLAGVIVVGVLAAKTAWDTRPPSASELTNARAQADLAADDPQIQAEVKDCEQHPDRYLGSGAATARCAAELEPSAKSMLDRDPLSLRRVTNTDGPRVAVLLAAAIVIGAATFVGADWGTESMRTQLLVRPRRLQVWLAKAITVVVASAVYTCGELTGGPVLSAVAAEAAPDHLRGRYLSLFQLSWAVGGVLAPAAYTFLLDHGRDTLWLVLLGVAVVAGGYATRLWRVVPSAALAVVDRAR